MQLLMQFTLIFLFSLCASAVASDLRIEVTKGLDKPVRVAVVPFKRTGWGRLPEKVSDVVASDLQLSGRFVTTPVDRMLSRPHRSKDVLYRDWRLLKVEYLIIGSLTIRGNEIRVEYELHNVLEQSREFKEIVVSERDKLRDLGHHISDKVYEKLTGISGAFSTRIMYVTAVGPIEARTYRLNIADSDGLRVETVLETSEPILSPAWAPDGSRIAYVSFENDSKPAIYLQDLSKKTRRIITNFQGLNGAPSFSPDGEKLALVLSKSGNPDIWTYDLNTRKMTQITRHYGIDTEPSWFPDGQSLIFTSNRGGSPQIYKVDLHDFKIQRLTFEGEYNAGASLLSDGTGLVMVHRRNAVYHISLLDLRRGRLSALTQTSLDESPSIAPNGSMLIYATEEDGRGILAAVSIDGGVRFKLPSSEGEVREPAWSPTKRTKITSNLD